MSRDWFALTRKPLITRRHDPLADPLDGPDWQGLQWSLPLLTRMTGADRHMPEGDAPKCRPERLQTRSPFLIR